MFTIAGICSFAPAIMIAALRRASRCGRSSKKHLFPHVPRPVCQHTRVVSCVYTFAIIICVFFAQFVQQLCSCSLRNSCEVGHKSGRYSTYSTLVYECTLCSTRCAPVQYYGCVYNRWWSQGPKEKATVEVGFGAGCWRASLDTGHLRGSTD